MKPLTIEQLKALEVGDWVWLVDTGYGGEYVMVKGITDNLLHYETLATRNCRDFLGYSKTWLAYKNKEQAEAKGEIVELPCKVGDVMYGISLGGIEKAKLSEICYEVVTKDGHHLIGNFGMSLFADEAEAERRLAELKGEKI